MARSPEIVFVSSSPGPRDSDDYIRVSSETCPTNGASSAEPTPEPDAIAVCNEHLSFRDSNRKLDRRQRALVRMVSPTIWPMSKLAAKFGYSLSTIYTAKNNAYAVEDLLEDDVNWITDEDRIEYSIQGPATRARRITRTANRGTTTHPHRSWGVSEDRVEKRRTVKRATRAFIRIAFAAGYSKRDLIARSYGGTKVSEYVFDTIATNKHSPPDNLDEDLDYISVEHRNELGLLPQRNASARHITRSFTKRRGAKSTIPQDVNSVRPAATHPVVPPVVQQLDVSAGPSSEIPLHAMLSAQSPSLVHLEELLIADGIATLAELRVAFSLSSINCMDQHPFWQPILEAGMKRLDLFTLRQRAMK